MNWIALECLLERPQADRRVALQPAMDHDALCMRALGLAAGLQHRGVRRIAVHLQDAAELAVALLGAWRAQVEVLLLADLQPATRARLASTVELWLTDAPGDTPLDTLLAAPLDGARLDLDQCRMRLCTSGSSGEPKLIEKRLRQLANEVSTLEQLWGADLGAACVIGSVAVQHIYGLLFRVLWPLCAGRPFLRQVQPFSEDLQRASRDQAHFCWVTSPALLKRMGDNLDWPALRRVRRVFSSGGALEPTAAEHLAQRLGQFPTEVYGSSETGGIAWRRGVAPWQPFAGVTLGQDDCGALRVSSPCLPVGHVEQTADAVRIEPDGRFELLGRLDRIVKLEEKRVSLPMLESALAEHPFVAESRLGVLSEQRAYLAGLVALSPAGLHALRNGGRRALTDTLRRHLATHCETLALPRRWRLVQCLPFDSQGKLPQARVDACLQAPRPLQPERVSQRLDDNEWHVDLDVPLDLAHFSGHFPHTPVLPGVVQIDWALGLARELIAELPPCFRGMEVLKFQQLARPGDRLQLTLRFDAERSKLHFHYRNGGAPCSSGRILLGASR